MSNTQHAPFASPYSYSPPGSIVTPNNLACTIISEGGTDFYTVVVPAAGTFDAGANPMTLTTIYPGLLAKIVNNQAGDFLVKGSKAGDPGVLCLAGSTTVVTDDGKGNLMEVANSSTSGSSGTGPLFTSALARGVVTANIAALGAFPVTSANNDGITYVQGDIVLLMNQAAPAENGPYVVGAVVAGNAPLTRPGWWATGSLIPMSFEFKTGSEGTEFFNLIVFTHPATGAKVVGTDDPVLLFRRLSALVLANQTVFAGTGRGIATADLGHPGAGRVTITKAFGLNTALCAVKVTAATGVPTAQITFDTKIPSGTSIEVDSWAVAAATDEAFYVEINQ